MSNLSDRNKKTIFVPTEQSPDKAGFITETAAGTVPDGWLECNGDSVLVADYPELHAAIGYTYGGSGANFNLPSRAPEITTEWTDYTPNFNNFSVSSGRCSARRVGDTLEVQLGVTSSNAPGGPNIQLNINSTFGINVDTSKYDTDAFRNNVGSGFWRNAGTTHEPLQPWVTSAGNVQFWRVNNSLDNLEGQDIATGDSFSCVFSIAVSEFSQANSDGKVIIKAHTDKAGSSVGVENLSIQNDLTVNGAISNPGIKHMEYVIESNQGSYAGAGVANVVLYNTEVKKNGFTTEYNSGTGVFTASETGYYLITAGASISSPTGRINQTLFYLRVNGVAESDILYDLRFQSNQDLGLVQGSGSKVLCLTAGEYFDVLIYSIATANWTIRGTSPAHRTYLTITKIG